MARSTRILITGFGPFPGVHSNPSAKLVNWVNEGRAHMPPDAEILTASIPTSWTDVEAFAAGPLNEMNPDVALHFGVSRRARGFQIEEVAKNTTSNAADCEGKTYAGSCLARSKPPTLTATLNVRQLVNALGKRGLPASASRDAGSYLCNMLLYLSLDSARQKARDRLTAFIHIPPTGAGILDDAKLLQGLGIIAAHSLHHSRHAALLRKRRKED